MQLRDFHYDLPPELIARHPPARRSDARLLHLDAAGGEPIDRMIGDLPRLLSPGDLMVFNDTRVLKARLRGRKPTGGAVEILVERLLDAGSALVQARASKPLRAGMRIGFAPDAAVTVVDREPSGLWRVRAEDGDLAGLLERHGQVPLPPYLSREAGPDDAERYQCVYARHPGAVAAPTAGLHFDSGLLARLRERGVDAAFVTLHVGAGTFTPVRSARVEEHRMHAEEYEVGADVCAAVAHARERGGRVIAVGTTSVRALESAAATGQLRPQRASTGIFILPGYRFRVTDAIVTNFHLPESTLLMLVAAYAGLERVLAAYRHAVQRRYRFFSYGDAMLLTGAGAGAGAA
ncbi:MAG: tRNA preQ1(34) S-adenosylmethionine ribosyltransferase-isomerase QueA [Gammaproteobacteria bacterium]